MKRAAIYARVSTTDQHVESQVYDLRQMAAQRGLEVVKEYEDRGVSGTKARRPGLDALMADARQRKFSVVLVAAFDRVARSTKHFLHVIDEFDSLGVEFISCRENIDTSGPMGRLFWIIISSIAELESDLIRERVRAGMRRARLEGRRIGRARLDVNREQVFDDFVVQANLDLERSVLRGPTDNNEVDNLLALGWNPEAVIQVAEWRAAEESRAGMRRAQTGTSRPSQLT